MRQDGLLPSLLFFDGGVAHVKGTRLSVAQIISTWKQNYQSIDLTADYLEMPLEIIEAAVNYYQKNGAEIDREIDLAEAAQKWP